MCHLQEKLKNTILLEQMDAEQQLRISLPGKYKDLKHKNKSEHESQIDEAKNYHLPINCNFSMTLEAIVSSLLARNCRKPSSTLPSRTTTSVTSSSSFVSTTIFFSMTYKMTDAAKAKTSGTTHSAIANGLFERKFHWNWVPWKRLILHRYLL